MSRAELRKFLRAMAATVIAGLVAWFMAKLGVHIVIPQP